MTSTDKRNHRYSNSLIVIARAEWISERHDVPEYIIHRRSIEHRKSRIIRVAKTTIDRAGPSTFLRSLSEWCALRAKYNPSISPLDAGSQFSASLNFTRVVARSSLCVSSLMALLFF